MQLFDAHERCYVMPETESVWGLFGIKVNAILCDVSNKCDLTDQPVMLIMHVSLQTKFKLLVFCYNKILPMEYLSENGSST